MAAEHPASPTSLSGRPWIWPETRTATAPTAGEVPAWVLHLLDRRGIVGEAARARYLEPSLSALPEPLAMADMERAVERLLAALVHHERITIYGDYDVDGVASTALLVELLRSVGAHTDFYIPDRRAEGYGLNADAVRALAGRTDLLITTDTGVSAHAEISLARELGLDVIVVDHHQVPDTLPPANAVLDPHRADCSFPFKGLCATGVAFMLVVALRRALRERRYFDAVPEPDVRTLLDLVAVATVADMVPIRDTNRVLVAAGLKRMRQSPRLGLAALMEVSGITAPELSATDLGFRIGPRINARGRLAHAGEAVELMLTGDVERARALAKSLDTANQDRRALEHQTVEEAIAAVENLGLASQASLLLYDPSWHPGVLGLVASRLATRFHRPALVIGEGGKGSARSIEGLDLHASLAAVSEHLVRFGGHRAAAGVTVLPEHIDTLRTAWQAEVTRLLGAPPYVVPLRPEMELEETALSLATVAALERLEPFGQENPAPLFVSRGLEVRERRIVGSTHLKLRLGTDGHDAIAFGFGRHADALPETVDVAFRLERNRYRGRETLQLRIEDLRPALPRSNA